MLLNHYTGINGGVATGFGQDVVRVMIEGRMSAWFRLKANIRYQEMLTGCCHHACF